MPHWLYIHWLYILSGGLVNQTTPHLYKETKWINNATNQLHLCELDLATVWEDYLSQVKQCRCLCQLIGSDASTIWAMGSPPDGQRVDIKSNLVKLDIYLWILKSSIPFAYSGTQTRKIHSERTALIPRYLPSIQKHRTDKRRRGIFKTKWHATPTKEAKQHLTVIMSARLLELR